MKINTRLRNSRLKIQNRSFQRIELKNKLFQRVDLQRKFSFQTKKLSFTRYTSSKFNNKSILNKYKILKMSKITDEFGDIADSYEAFRPDYPKDLYVDLLKYVKENNVGNDNYMDVATGTGKFMKGLLPYFKSITLQDKSAKLLAKLATSHGTEKDEKDDNKQTKVIHKIKDKNVIISTIEGDVHKIDVDDSQYDVVSAAQSIHWFDLDVFFKEMKRVLKPNGIFLATTYISMQLNEDEKIARHMINFWKTLQPHWSCNRELIDTGFKDMQFPFKNIKRIEYSIEKKVKIHDLSMYMSTISAYHNYTKLHVNEPNLIKTTIKNLKKEDGIDNDYINIRIPYILLMGQNSDIE